MTKDALKVTKKFHWNIEKAVKKVNLFWHVQSTNIQHSILIPHYSTLIFRLNEKIVETPFTGNSC